MSTHRQNGSGKLRTDQDPYSWWNIVASLFLLSFIFGCMALGAKSDERANEDLEAIAQAELDRKLMPLRIREAYEAGMSEALQSVKDTPQGIALTQACMFRGYRYVDVQERQ